MIRLDLILFAVFLIYSPGTVSIKYENDHPLGIMYGFHAKEGEFPFQVFIHWRLWSAGTFCGGTIINKQHIITSAACGRFVKHFKLKDFYVGAGVTKRNDTKHLIIKEIETVKVHERYDPATKQNEICIIKIKGEFSYSRTVQPIEINPEKIKEGTNCTIIGWGYTAEHPWVYSNELNAAYVPIAIQTECANVLSYFHTIYLDSMVCAGQFGSLVGYCRGDIGGPLVCDGKLTGIMSWLTPCDSEFQIYTRIEHYVEWIKKNSAI